MSELTAEQIKGIVQAIEKTPEHVEEKIPLRPSLKQLGRLSFSPLSGEKPRPLSELTEKETSQLGEVKLGLEVVYGKTHLLLREVAALEEGNLIKLDNFCDDLVDIYVNGKRIGRGEVVAADGSFGVKIISLDN